MSQQEIEQGFELLKEAVALTQKALDTSFLDSYIETGENILDNLQVRVIDGVPDDFTVQQLQERYQKFQKLDLNAEEMRKVTQLVLLNGMMSDAVQPNHQLTPDALGFLLVYLIEQLYATQEKKLSLLDLSVGAGNLLLTVMINLQLANFDVASYGVDIDDTLLAVAAVNTQLIQQEVQLLHQDGIQSLLLDPVDVAISDLPVGYYPNDENAREFTVYHSEGHTYAHHLLLEQSMKYVRESGYGLFLVPENILETEQVADLKTWLGRSVYLQGLLKLPTSLFQTKGSRKSILILQNKGEQSAQAKEVLLAELPSLKDTQAIRGFFEKFANWKKQNLN